jgi:aminopeptidase N
MSIELSCHGMQFGPDFAPTDTKPQRLPDTTYDSTHVRLELEVDIPKRRLAGWCRTTLTILAEKTSTIEFNAVDMKIEEVLVEDKKARFIYDGKILAIQLPRPAAAGTVLTVSKKYSVENPKAGIYFFMPDKQNPNRPLQAWTATQTDDSRCWFPCHDVPGEKATSETILTVPAGMTAVANGVLASEKKDGKTRTFHFKMNQPHSMYLYSIVVGWLEEVRDDLGTLPVQYIVPEGKAEEARRGFGKTPKAIALFNEITGTPYPYERYGQVAAYQFGGGMEHTTVTTQTDAALLDKRAALDMDFDGLVAHELAHQWFGDLVTCREWSHAWLNESFATYYELLFQEHDKGLDEFRYRAWTYANNYFEEDRAQYRRPIATKVWRESFGLFDRHLYPKGACVLHFFRSLVGDAAWRRAIKVYLEKHRFGAVETNDLLEAIRTATGVNLDQQFDQWIYRGGHPEFKIAYRWDNGQAIVYIAQTQPALFEIPVEFRFDNVTKIERLTKSEHTFAYRLSSEPKTVVFDPESKLFLKKVDFLKPPAMWKTQLDDANVNQRIEAVQALATPANVGLLEKTYAKETFWGVRAEIAKALAKIRNDAAREALGRMLKEKHPKARRVVVESLGEFREPRHAPQFLSIFKSDPSYFVSAAALVALAKTGSPQAKKAIAEAAKMNSWNDTMKVAAVQATAEFEGTVEALLSLSKGGQPELVRAAAIGALGRVGKGDPRVTEALTSYLTERVRFVPGAAAHALAAIGDPSTHAALKTALSQVRNSGLRATIDRAARILRLGQTSDVPEAASANGKKAPEKVSKR